MPARETATYLEPVERERDERPRVTDAIGASLLLTREEWAGTLDPEVLLRAKLNNALRSMWELAEEGWGRPGPRGET